MGQQAVCVLRLGQNVSRGTLLLESRELIFRGDPRIVIPFKEMKSVQAADGVLQVKFSGGLGRFEIGLHAERWAQKILHPPSLLDKLDVKPSMTVSLLGLSEKDFEAQLRERGSRIALEKPQKDSDLIFFAAEAAGDLKRLAGFIKLLKPAGAVWVVYPKGRKEITENGVLAAGKAAGLVDVKVCSFSATHTALKFVIPVSHRA